MKKIREKKGESIAETLVALMIVSMSLTILAGAIVSAARVNSRFDNKDKAVISPETPIERNKHISVKRKNNDGSTGAEVANFTVHIYGTENEYYYYEAD